MRKVFSVIILFITLIQTAYTQGHNCGEDLLPRRNEDNKMYGYANLFGIWRVTPIFTKTYPFEGRVGKVLQGYKYGAVNCDGRLVIKTEYDAIEHFIGGLAWAQKEGKWGLLNAEGDVLLNPIYDEVDDVSRYTDYTWVRKDSLWGLYDKKQQHFVREVQYPLYEVLVDSTSLVKVGSRYAILSHNTGEYVIEPEMEHVKKVAPFTIAYEIKGKWGVVRDDGEKILPPQYDSIALAGKHRLIIKKEKKYGFIDPKGKKVTPLKYESLTAFDEGASRFKYEGKYGFLSYYGNEAIPPIYEEATPLHDFRSIVKKGGKYGVIDRKMNYLITNEYQKIVRENKNDFYVSKNDSGKHEIWNLYGVKVSKTSFDSVYYHDDERAVRVIYNHQVTYFDTKEGGFLFDKLFDEAQAFEAGLAIVQKDELIGVVDKEGEIVIPLEYNQVERLQVAGNLFFKVTKENKTGVYLHTGKEIVPVVFTNININGDLFEVRNASGKTGFYATTGKELTLPIFDSVNQLGTDSWLVILKKDDEYGLMNDRGDFLIALGNYQIMDVGGGLLSVQKGSKFYLYNVQGNLVLDQKFKAIGEYNESLLAVMEKKSWGYIDKKGGLKIPYQFEKASKFVDGKACVVKEGKKGSVDRRGRFREEKCD